MINENIPSGHGGNRPGSGRPAIEEIRKNHSIKFTDAEWEAIREAATAANMTMSDYVRKKALEK